MLNGDESGEVNMNLFKGDDASARNASILNGMMTRKEFYDEAGFLLKSSPGRKFAMIYFDIYSFMAVKDFCGAEQSNSLIEYIGECFREHEDSWSLSAHFGADVFVLLTHFKQREELVDMVVDIHTKIRAYPSDCKILPAFGICIAGNDRKPSILCDCAKLAQENIKGKVFQYFAFYEPSYHDNLLAEIKLENKMQQALKDGEFVVYLQPKVYIPTGAITGAEALVRWVENDGNIINPMDFIPIFEKNGFIISLDTYVWEETFKILRRWKDRGYELLPISINVSRLHVYNDDFINILCNLSKKYDILPDNIRLELTESAFIEDIDKMYEYMKTLKKEGFVFSMDDYGSGYSTLKMLVSQPIDEVKIDRSFLNDIESKKTRTILNYTTGMIKELAVNMIAEGVETQEQADYLTEIGCENAQGFLFYMPMPVNIFEQIVYGSASVGNEA